MLLYVRGATVNSSETYSFTTNLCQLFVGSFKLSLKLTLVFLNHQCLHKK